jgi:two-component system, NarL family, sensor histidine kinase UhpB
MNISARLECHSYRLTLKKILTFFSIILSYNYLIAQNVQNIDSMLQIIKLTDNDSIKVKNYHSVIANMALSDPNNAIKYAKTALLLTKKINNTKSFASLSLMTAHCFAIIGQHENAILYLDSALPIFKKNSKNGTIAFAYVSRAEYCMQLQKYTASLIACDSALYYYELSNNTSGKALAYQTIGAIYYKQENYNQSLLYFEKAYDIKKNTSDFINIIKTLNSIGEVHHRKKQYDLSIATYKKVVAILNDRNYKNYIALIYTNLSSVTLDKGDSKTAEAYVKKAIVASREQKNDLQLATALSVLAKIYLKTELYQEAIKTAKESQSLEVTLNAKEIEQETTQLLADAYAKSNEYKMAFDNIQKSDSLNANLYKLKYNDEIALLQTQLKVNEKNKAIELLEKEKKIKEQELTQQYFILGGSLLILSLIVIGIVLALNRNKLKQRMKDLEFRNQIAADLHDEVGSSLSSINMLGQMAAQQNNPSALKDILNRMGNNTKETMDILSDIVWMTKPLATSNESPETDTSSLIKRMERFAYEISNSKNIECSLHLSAFENLKLNVDQRKNIYLIFKEAMNNAVKYSGSEKIEVIGEFKNNELQLHIKDFGKGFDVNLIQKGNGLENMQYRANKMGGNVTTVSNNNGTYITLNLKLST